MCLFAVLNALGTHPQQVAGDVALPVAAPRPPPLRLHLVLAPQHRHAVALHEAQLVLAPRLVVPQGVDHAAVHHAHLLLDACRERERERRLETPIKITVDVN